MTTEAIPAVPTTPSVDAAKVAQAPVADTQVQTVRVKAHERALKVKAKLEASEGGDEPAPEPKEKPAAKPSIAKTAPPREPEPEAKTEPKPEPELDAAAKEREANRIARQERIAKAQQREREADEERLAKQHGKKLNEEIERLRKRISELEPHEQVFKDEDTLLAAAEARGMSPEKLATWMRTRLSDPTAVAQRQAQTVEERLRAEIRQMQERLERTERERQQEQERIRQQGEDIRRAQTFITKAHESERTHPLTAGLLAKHGERGLIAFANQFVAPLLPEGYAIEELHDHIEQLLDEIQVSAREAAKQPGNPANGTSQPNPKNGAAQPTTLSNGLSSERVSVAEEVPFARLPRQDRVRLIKEKLDRQ